MWIHISLIGVNRFAISYCVVICNVTRNKVKIYWWFWAYKARFCCSVSSQTVLLDQLYAMHRKPKTWALVIGCTCTCLPTITHGHDITIMSYGCAVASPTGCQKVDHVVARRWGGRAALRSGVPARSLLAVEANLFTMEMVNKCLTFQDNLKCHMRKATKHSWPTYAYNYNKI